MQRFGSALNLNLHFHALFLDGAYSCVPGELAPKFHASLPLEDEHVAELAATLRRRVTRYLERRGRLPRKNEVEHDEAPQPDLLAQICAASVQNRGALAPELPPPVARIGRRCGARAPSIQNSLCCDDEGFSARTPRSW